MKHSCVVTPTNVCARHWAERRGWRINCFKTVGSDRFYLQNMRSRIGRSSLFRDVIARWQSNRERLPTA
eukprot:4464486-Pyramimonas_sp.AAC.1